MGCLDGRTLAASAARVACNGVTGWGVRASRPFAFGGIEIGVWVVTPGMAGADFGVTVLRARHDQRVTRADARGANRGGPSFSAARAKVGAGISASVCLSDFVRQSERGRGVTLLSHGVMSLGGVTLVSCRVMSEQCASVGSCHAVSPTVRSGRGAEPDTWLGQDFANPLSHKELGSHRPAKGAGRTSKLGRFILTFPDRVPYSVHLRARSHLTSSDSDLYHSVQIYTDQYRSTLYPR